MSELDAETKYIYDCYGLPADMLRVHMVKEDYEIECHSWREVGDMLKDGYRLTSQKSSISCDS